MVFDKINVMQKPEFIEFNTKDGLTLPGLFYRADRSKKTVICLHGNGSSSVFYNEQENKILADTLKKQNISVLFFNNRGANIIKKLNVKKSNEVERKRFGMAYEKIKECIEDIDGAVSFLEKIGYKEFYLAGTSTGANKICVYNFYKPENKISKYILYCGGDDAGLYYKTLGNARFKKILAKAKEKIKAGEGEEISSELLPYDLLFSYLGFYDIANPDGDYNVFPYYEVINKVKLSNKPLFRYFKS